MLVVIFFFCSVVKLSMMKNALQLFHVLFQALK
jgi:hypothetical protein